MEQIYVLLVTTSNMSDTPDVGISDVGLVYRSKEDAIKTVLEFGYKPLENQEDIFEKVSDGGMFRHRYKIVTKNLW